MSRENKTDFDTIVVGGGLLGVAVGVGLVREGQEVLLIDGGDGDLRASRGNFGLAWVQGKGADDPAYARWTLEASAQWPAFSRDLQRETEVDLAFEQRGGLDFCLDEKDWADRSDEMRRVSEHTDGAFTYEMLSHSAVAQRVPGISKAVLGASYSPHDGHLNPLYLLKALHRAFLLSGGVYRSRQRVDTCGAVGDRFELHTDAGRLQSNRLVLCAGLDNTRLAACLGMDVPLQALRGQLLITERVGRFLDYPSIHVRQTGDGTLQIGDTHENVGLDDGTTGEAIALLAARAVKIFPFLRDVHLNRAWGALRVMTPDGSPIYQQSSRHPGAFCLSCHSGVTLAPVHVGPLSRWIAGRECHPLIGSFDAGRFDVQAA